MCFWNVANIVRMKFYAISFRRLLDLAPFRTRTYRSIVVEFAMKSKQNSGSKNANVKYNGQYSHIRMLPTSPELFLKTVELMLQRILCWVASALDVSKTDFSNMPLLFTLYSLVIHRRLFHICWHREPLKYFDNIT